MGTYNPRKTVGDIDLMLPIVCDLADKVFEPERIEIPEETKETVIGRLRGRNNTESGGSTAPAKLSKVRKLSP